MANKSKVKKVLTTLAELSIAAGAIFGGYKIADSMGLINNTPQTQQLSVVQNIAYDETNYVFSWDAVDNADAYVVDINGSTKQVDTNACFHVPTEEVTEFKVKAIDTTGEFEDSKWSNVYTHTVDATVEENLYSKVNIFVNDILDGFKLKEIVAVYANGNNLYTQVICQYNRSDYFHNIITEYDTPITSIEQAMSLESGVSYLGMGQQIVDHNSAEHLLKSDTLTGSLEDYKKEGYTISVVASQTVQENGYADGSAYSIFGTYKLEKNGEVKYVQAAYQCVITNPSSNPTTNYTTKLENSNDRYLSELNFTELTGDFEEYAETMDRLNSTVLTNFGHANQQSGDDIEIEFNFKDEFEEAFKFVNDNKNKLNY